MDENLDVYEGTPTGRDCELCGSPMVAEVGLTRSGVDPTKEMLMFVDERCSSKSCSSHAQDA